MLFRIKNLFEFWFILFYNMCESTGMLARGRKKSYILAMSFMALFYPTVQNIEYSADALFILQKFCPILVGGPVAIQQHVCVKATGVIQVYDFLNPLTVKFL